MNDDFKAIFDRIDQNKDGLIVFEDLVAELNRFSLKNQNNDARLSNSKQKANSVFMFLKKNPENDHLSFQEFIEYCLHHDKKLFIVFRKLDSSDSGRITENDIINAFSDINTPISLQEARLLLNKIHKSPNKVWSIDYSEWRRFMLLHNEDADLKNALHFWQIASYDSFDSQNNFSFFKSWILQLSCGGIVGVISRTCTAPLDRIRVLRQVYGYKHINEPLWKAVSYMVREGGVFSLWRGNGTNLLKIGPESAIKLAAFKLFRSTFQEMETSSDSFLRRNNSQVVCGTVLAGGLAGLISQSFVYPLEVVKTRMCLRTSHSSYQSIMSCFSHVYLDGGLRAFYRGYLLNVTGVIPYAGVEMGLYSGLRGYYKQWQNSRSETRISEPIPPQVTLGTSFIATSTAILFTYPLQLMRVKMQSKAHFSDVVEGNNVRGLAKKIFTTEGVSGFYRGIVPTFLKVLPSSAFTYFLYEYLDHRFELKTFTDR